MLFRRAYGAAESASWWRAFHWQRGGIELDIWGELV